MKKKNHYLTYDLPFDFKSLLATYRSHQVANLESFDDSSMTRVFSHAGKLGKIRISNQPEQSRIKVEIDAEILDATPEILKRVRSLFDLDFDHAGIDLKLRSYKRIHKLHLKYPGLRISSGWDTFEIAITTVLGQLVSVERARSLTRDLVEMYGEDTELELNGLPVKLFPTPERLATANLEKLKTTRIRKKTIQELAKAVMEKRIVFDRDQSLVEFEKKMLAIYGIGPWTASYVALKALKHTDAFPGSDLILARALQLFPKGAMDKLAPHRGLVAILLWKEYAAKLTGKKSK